MSAGRISPQLSKYKISRRGRKLQVSDDQRTLLALPKDVPERTWYFYGIPYNMYYVVARMRMPCYELALFYSDLRAEGVTKRQIKTDAGRAEILQKEENDLVCFDIREEILDEALRICYDRYMERQNALFTTHCAAQAWLKLIDWHFYRHDPGEEPSAHPACFIPHRVESWTPDELPAPSPKDTWGKQELAVVEEMPDDTLARWPSNESVQYPAVAEIPREYWFPGKVEYQKDYAEEQGEEFDVDEIRRRRHKTAPGHHGGKDSYVSDEVSSENIVAGSEVLQKITDYSQEMMAKESSTSVPKSSTPMEGSLHGAGDSTVGADQPRQKRLSLKKAEKSKFFSRPSVSGRSRILAPLDGADSRSRISAISDCRLRNLRLETQHEVASEKVDTPQGGSSMRRK